MTDGSKAELQQTNNKRLKMSFFCRVIPAEGSFRQTLKTTAPLKHDEDYFLNKSQVYGTFKSLHPTERFPTFYLFQNHVTVTMSPKKKEHGRSRKNIDKNTVEFIYI